MWPRVSRLVRLIRWNISLVKMFHLQMTRQHVIHSTWFPFVVRAAAGRGGVSSWRRIRMTTITPQGPPEIDLHTLRLEADVRVVRHVDTMSKTYWGDMSGLTV